MLTVGLGLNIKSFELPSTYQKSYYGKALVVTMSNEKRSCAILSSYRTNVCCIDENGELKRLWGDYSATTMKHINDFLRYFGKKPINKKIWESMEVTTL